MNTLNIKDKLIILIAPNVGEQMGGEAIKALQIFQEYKKRLPNTLQVTHERNRAEIEGRLQLADVFFIDDDFISLFLWKSRVFRFLLDAHFSKKAVKLAEQLAKVRGYHGNDVIIHQTEPNSPVVPRHISSQHINVFGPINGNVYFPKIFKHKESLSDTLRRVLHIPIQKINAFLFSHLSKADMIFVAGGQRTVDSLKAANCPEDIMVETIDCGMRDSYLSRPRITHQGNNYRFIHFGRLVPFKCTDLIVKALAKTQKPITLDIIGSGPELPHCKQIADELNLNSRVNFIAWREHKALLDSLSDYRGVVLPSIGDSNGIVIQEALALGLPPICLDWGGPQLLIDHEQDGFLIKPVSETLITDAIAKAMDTLSEDPNLAESFSVASRDKAAGWLWSSVTEEWLSHYSKIQRLKA